MRQVFYTDDQKSVLEYVRLVRVLKVYPNLDLKVHLKPPYGPLYTDVLESSCEVLLLRKDWSLWKITLSAVNEGDFVVFQWFPERKNDMLTIYGKEHCPNCDKIKSYCKAKGFDFEYLQLGKDYTKEELLAKVPNARFVPIIFNKDFLIGGFEDAKRWIDNHEI